MELYYNGGINYKGDGSYQSFSWTTPYTQRCFGLWCMHNGSDPVAYCVYGNSISTSGVTIRGTGVYGGDGAHVGWAPSDIWGTAWISIGI